MGPSRLSPKLSKAGKTGLERSPDTGHANEAVTPRVAGAIQIAVDLQHNTAKAWNIGQDGNGPFALKTIGVSIQCSSQLLAGRRVRGSTRGFHNQVVRGEFFDKVQHLLFRLGVLFIE